MVPPFLSGLSFDVGASCPENLKGLEVEGVEPSARSFAGLQPSNYPHERPESSTLLNSGLLPFEQVHLREDLL